MRILHVLDHSLPLHSGYTFRTANILRQQRALGWETFHLTSPKQGPTAAAVEEIDGLVFYRTPLPQHARGSLFAPWQMMQATAARLESLARQLRPDLLHAHSPVLNAWPALAVGWRLRIPVVYEIRAFWEDAAVDHGTQKAWGWRYRLTRALETWACRQAHQVVTICEGLRTDLLARGIAAAKVHIVPNAVDIHAFALGGRPDAALQAQLGLNNCHVLGFIGSFYAYEGLDVLLRALPAVLTRLPHTRLLLVGGGPQEAALKQQAQALGLTNHIVFVGRVPHEQVSRYYDVIDLLVYPRHSLRLTELVTPLKPLEAMAQGRLLVASDVGGHRELIRHGENGWLFRAGDPAALAEAIFAALTAPAGGAAIRERARRFVEQERTWALSVARYQTVYAAALGRARPAAH